MSARRNRAGDVLARALLANICVAAVPGSGGSSPFRVRPRCGGACPGCVAVQEPLRPTSAYREQQTEGWRVEVNERLVAETNLCERTLKLLAAQLYQIARVVPPEPLAKLRQIPIWVERSSAQFPCMCYHESRDWLSTHGVNPDKTGAVELANPETFLAWTHEQPWMVLHELAHGYHQRFLGHDHVGIRRCYEQAKAGKTYESVLRINGKKDRH